MRLSPDRPVARRLGTPVSRPARAALRAAHGVTLTRPMGLFSRYNTAHDDMTSETLGLAVPLRRAALPEQERARPDLPASTVAQRRIIGRIYHGAITAV